MNLRYPTSPVPSKRAAVFYAAYFGVLGLVLLFMGPYLAARGVAAIGIGSTTAAFSFAKLVYTPALGARVDRGFWFRGILTSHMAVSAVAALSLGFLESPILIGIAFFFAGLGYGTVLPLVESAILERLPAGGYGALRVWGSVGFVTVATLAAGVVSDDVTNRFPVALAVGMAVLGLCCLPLEIFASPPRAPGSGVIPGSVLAMLALLTLHQVAHGPYYAFFSIHLEQHGYSALMIGGLWSLGVVAEMAAFWWGGRLEGRFGLRRLLGAALLLTPARWVLLSLTPTVPTLLASQLGHAATFALVHLAGIQLVQANVPSESVRKAQALYSGLTFGLGIVVGTALAGPLYGVVGGAGSFLAAAGLSALLFAVWIPIARRMRGASVEG
jgi:PPP family 3-phenylpropionic acid transporter